MCIRDSQYSDRDYVVDLTIPEFTCICPKTALPDFALIKVSYKPAKVCLELKSLKLYLVEYRNVGIFHEHLVNKPVSYTHLFRGHGARSLWYQIRGNDHPLFA